MSLGLKDLDGFGLQFVNIGMEYLVHEANARRFIWILIRQLDVYFPNTAIKWSYTV